ncbi:MAG TPA: NAD(P)H-binding protein [Thermoanaerobaculia bacterium]
MIERRFVFVAGGTGYIGRSVIPRLLERGHSVKALVRPGSERRLPAGATPVMGNALDRESFGSQVRPCDTYLQLVGVAHPSPSKAEEFRRIDLASARASAAAARRAGVAHFVYLSVAQPAPAMKAYVEARAAGEAAIREAGLNATFLRPWYVLGPGHRWPALLWPGYWLAERFAPTRETARRIGLVTLSQMTAAIVRAVETPAAGVRIVEVPEIRKARL